ncbi:MAG: hypothetical protein IJD55_03550 [Clostridia bacterium]|nr:hypothetical protein [Clostridia bacterium]
MSYTRDYNTVAGENGLVFPWLIFLVTLLMIPIGGTNYLQILFACYVYCYAIFKKSSERRIEDSNISTYGKYFVIFMYISVPIGLISGVGLRTQFADILTSALPYISMVIGSYYATKYRERSNIKLVAIILIIEFFVGLGQNLNEGFRQFVFELYDTETRLISYVAEDVGRAVGTLRSPNYYGLVCVILGIVFVGLFFDKESRKNRTYNAFNSVMILVIVSSVVFSVSKTAVICISCVLVLCSMLSPSLNRPAKFCIFILCIIAINILIPKFEDYSNRVIDISSMTGRSDNWKRIIELGFSNNPGRIFFGYGNGYSTAENLGIYADSFYILLLFEQGIIGMIGYFITWITIVIKTYKRKPSIYRTYTLCLICVMLLSDITAAITDMPIVCIIVYYLIGRYSTLSMCDDKMLMWKGDI